MDRNTFTGLFLILVILVGSTFLLKPSQEEIKKEQQRKTLDSLRKINGGKLKAPTTNASFTPQKTVIADSAVLKGPLGNAITAAPKLVTLENKELKVTLSTQGGRILSVELKNEKTFDKKPLILLSPEQSKFGLSLNVEGKQIQTNDLNFIPSAPALNVSGKDSSTLTMHLAYGVNQSIDYVYSLKGEGYKVGYTLILNNMNNVVNARNNQVTLDWEASLRKQERDMKMERTYSTVYLEDTEGGINDLSLTKDDQKNFTDKKIQWVSFKQRFFSNVLITKDGFTSADVAVATDINSNDVKQMSAKMQLPYSGAASVSYPMEFYFGPNRFSTLKAQGYHLERQIDLGWGPLKYINRFAVLPVFNFLKAFNWNYGLIILVLTVLLKLVLFPLTYKSYLSMAKMRVLKPEMDEIKGKVGEDNPTLLQQEYLKLYKKAGVNPLGGCLPLVIQMPIILAFFRFFPNLFELRGQSFLWMHDLSTYDSVISFPLIPFLNWDHISLMCLLMTISTLIQTYFNNQTSGATGQMKYIGYITPLIFFGVLNSYPAGLNYYYFCANILTFSQQYFIRLMVDDKKIHTQIQENKKKPEDPNKKKSGFAAKMEELMRQQRQTPAIQTKKK
ncbi:membrane protein insertase YidC [Mucilaginibacter arboris]|uniref:Membrane protein insertase YidC n=1 Tax=Mucilaginibacter arboris TaxID=2682090 RepID=A0A7K1SZ75_9SPHI|nr:membrane protein insertase YidC [Mucilaginibacter arboris]MVN22603.1 membrane protein insertase YidC [Mucilaginibacter arboris]